MASPSTSTLRSGTVSRFSGGGAREKSWCGALRLLLLERREEVAAEPAAAAPPLAAAAWRGRATEAGEIEELRRGGTDDADQHRKRHRQHDQRAGLGQSLKNDLGLDMRSRSCARDQEVASV